MSEMADMILMHSQMGFDEKGRRCTACGASYGHAAGRTLHRRASEHIAAVLAAAGFGDVRERDAALDAVLALAEKLESSARRTVEETARLVAEEAAEEIRAAITATEGA